MMVQRNWMMSNVQRAGQHNKTRYNDTSAPQEFLELTLCEAVVVAVAVAVVVAVAACAAVVVPFSVDCKSLRAFLLAPHK
eukprot:1087480-Amphidinium_carterae.1